MNDGPLIVQSRQDAAARGRPPARGRAAARRSRRSPSSSASPEHIHTYRLTPLGLWNARAAGHDAEQVVDTLLELQPLRRARTRCWSTSPRRWPATAGCGWRSTPCTGWCSSRNDRPVLEEVLRAKKIAGMLGDADRRRHASPCTRRERGNLKQALLKLGWPAEDFAGYVDGEAHAIELDEDGLVAAAVPEGGRRVVLARRLRRRRAPLRRRQDDGRRGRDGRGQGDHADPGHQHRRARGSGRTS